jgi:ligand-binding SRPBCC domain-containing protein
MSVHQLKIVQEIPIPVKHAWDFFSRPGNLQLITPPGFQFKILTKLDERPIYIGQVIDYTLRPLFTIPVRWTTLITEVEEEIFFVDEQTRGPYKYWRHKHIFKPITGGTEMTDELEYEIPGGLAGDLINSILVKNELRKLFDYRYSKISTLMKRMETNGR